MEIALRGFLKSLVVYLELCLHSELRDPEQQSLALA